MRKLTVVFDDREKYEMLFPAVFYWRPDDQTTVFSVNVKRARLQSGDYHIDGHRRDCLIERKASVSELRANLFGAARKRYNFLAGLDRMVKESKHPLLFLDMTWKELAQDWDERGRSILRYPIGLYSHLFQELAVRGIETVGPIPARTVSQRRLCGSLLLDKMLTFIHPRRSLSADGVITSETGDSVPPLTGGRKRGDRINALRLQKDLNPGLLAS
jgi:hypothetical protein